MCPLKQTQHTNESGQDVKQVVVGMGHKFVEMKQISAYLLALCGFVCNGVNQICFI